MSRRGAWLLGGGSILLISAIVAFMAMNPGRDWSDLETADAIRSRASPEEAFEGVSKVSDRTSSVRPGRNVVFDVDCPDGPEAMACAAGAARAVAIWAAAHGRDWRGTSGQPGEVSWLLINVTTPELSVGAAGPQLIGDVQPVAALEQTTVQRVLDRFMWNGAGEEGDQLGAAWCLKRDGRGAFCAALAAEACNPLAQGDLANFCRVG